MEYAVERRSLLGLKLEEALVRSTDQDEDAFLHVSGVFVATVLYLAAVRHRSQSKKN